MKRSPHAGIVSPRLLYVLVPWLGLSGAGQVARAADGDVRLNSVGYPTTRAKVATVVGGGTTFVVRRAGDDGEALSGSLSAPMTDPDTGATVRQADFSALTTPGTYRLDVPSVGKSAPFTIDEAPYQDTAKAVMLGFLGWRCGTAVSFTYKGETFGHKACHLADGLGDYIGQAGVTRDGTGGWHDAGDYGKYTVNGAFAAGMMMDAWERHKGAWTSLTWDLPEKGGAVPDLLDEIKVELDWLAKMQYGADGKVSHKLTRTDFEGFVMPEADNGKRFFVAYGTAATADLVAALAQGARVFAPYDAAAAARYQKAADLSYAYLKANPTNVAAVQTDFKTGGYTTTDGDDRLWAAAEMWETTGNADALTDLETRLAAQTTLVDADFDWGNVKNLGVLTYLLSSRPGRNAALVQRVRDAAVKAADSLVANAKASGYGRALTKYYWSSNGGLARTAMLLDAVAKLTGESRYLDVIVHQLSWLFGRNQYGRSQLTGVGVAPPLNPHHRPSGADALGNPFPGLLVGGGSKVDNWQDLEDDYEVNEVAINWNAPLVYALGVFLAEGPPSQGNDAGTSPGDAGNGTGGNGNPETAHDGGSMPSSDASSSTGGATGTPTESGGKSGCGCRLGTTNGERAALPFAALVIALGLCRRRRQRPPHQRLG